MADRPVPRGGAGVKARARDIGRGVTVVVDGQRVTLLDRAPGTGMWWVSGRKHPVRQRDMHVAVGAGRAR